MPCGVIGLGHHYHGSDWFATGVAPSHYLNQYQPTVNWGEAWTNLSKLVITMQKEYICKLLSILFRPLCFNSPPPSAAYMHQWTGSSLVWVMACRLIGAKPLPTPMLTYCQLDSWGHYSVKFESEFYHFQSRKCNWKCHLPKWRPFCPGGDELKDLFWKSLAVSNPWISLLLADSSSYSFKALWFSMERMVTISCHLLEETYEAPSCCLLLW